ncbi:MAG TPA: peptidoglycan-binding domain-containing protein, partial [Ignavibacteriaceae bacterium]|nr:peptidoglycan-binding domain-containing protein [Ignavibacteriaceae bacterium]
VFFMFTGKRSNWVDSSDDKHQVEDIQQILKWISFNFEFDCDPGDITNKMNPETEQAILNFQKRYNIDFVTLNIHQNRFNHTFTKIDEDGKVGKQTWGAFFDMYTLELLIVMGITEDGLNDERAKLQFMKKSPPHPAPVIGCGENHPASQAKTEDENPVDRRVEILFFDEGEEPELKCHPQKFTCIASKCDLYPKGFFKRNPVKVDPLPLPSGLAVRVHLKFLYKTPEGTERTFPSGFPYTLKFDDNTEEQKTIDNDRGQVFLQILRSKKSFTITFKFSESNFIGEPKDTTAKDELLKEADIKEKIKDGFKVFNLPVQFDLKNTTWTLSPAVSNFNDTEKKFTNLDDLSIENIGSEASPIQMTLDPHWRFYKFQYFDRLLKAKKSILPLLIEGFLDSSKTGTTPDLKSNWTTDTEGCQCLPFVLQNTPSGVKPLIQFRTDANTFIESRKDGTRNFVSGTAKDNPEGDRLRFYDLPVFWKSKTYFARLSGGTGNPPAKVGKFEDLSSEITSDTKPLIFSLDDIVLTDKDLNPIKWIPDNKIENRISIFCNTFSRSGPNTDDLSSEGLYKPDGKAFIDSTNIKTFTKNNNGFFTQLPADEKTRNYISDYPDWTRLIIAQGNFFDAFNKRTLDGKGDVTGARAAVAILDVFASPATFVQPRTNRPRLPVPIKSNFCEVQAFFEQDHVIFNQIGRFDMVRLRCCEIDSDDVTEISACMVFLRLFFNFNSNIKASFNPKAVPLNLTGNTALDWIETAILNLLHRWNGPDIVGKITFNPGSAFVLPLNAADKKFKCKVIWFAQSLPKEKSHFEIGVFKDTTDPGGVRGFMRSKPGEGVLGETDNAPLFKVTKKDKSGKTEVKDFGGFFTFAHESGHGGSLVDEYIEPTVSGAIPGFDSYSPGSPFSLDDQAMMRANREVRARHYWHIAEWFRQLDGNNKIEYKINHGKFNYILPHISDDPKNNVKGEPVKNFIGWPAAEKNDQKLGAHGKFNIFFYPLGEEKYSAEFLPGLANSPGVFDGLIIVLVKIEMDFPTKDDTKIRKFISTVDGNISLKFNFPNKFGAQGNLLGKKFNRILLNFAPRYFAENFSTTKRTDTSEHIFVKIRDTGKAEWDSGLLSNDHKLFFPMDKPDSFANFFGNMIGLADGTLGTPASYEPVAKIVIPDAKVFSL